MPWYKLTKGSLGLIIDGESVDVERGQTVELPEEKAREFKYLKLTSAPPVVRNGLSNNELLKSETKEQDGVRNWSTTQDMKAPDVIDLINETDSKEDLTSLQEVEEKGQNRVGVLNAIKKRMGQIGG